MKTVTMSRDFDYRPKPGVIIAYRGDRTYHRVPEAAVAAITAADAGKIDNVKARRPRKIAGEDGGAAGGSPLGDQASAG